MHMSCVYRLVKLEEMRDKSCDIVSKPFTSYILTELIILLFVEFHGHLQESVTCPSILLQQMTSMALHLAQQYDYQSLNYFILQTLL